MTQPATVPFSVEAVRAGFPLLHQEINGYPLAYLDSAASSQKPVQVLEATDRYYRTINANIHRGVYAISEAATEAYELARREVGRFIGARNAREVIFTHGTTESINLVAQSWGRTNLQPGDRILLTVMEHHSNLVPWQLVAAQTGAHLDYLRIDGQGRLVLEDLEHLLTERTRLVALTAMSNVLGTINPIHTIVERARAVGALVLIDGAQSVPHLPTNVRELDIDFLAFSGHKLCGPTGIGVLWGRRELLEAMPPYMTGGGMIRKVTLEGSTWAELPAKFEAGTPPIAGAIGLAAAVGYLQTIGMAAIHEREKQLAAYALPQLSDIPGVEVLGPPADERGGLVSFVLAGVHAHDVAALLDRFGIAVRAGHHCTHPLHDLLGIPASVRASFYLYTLEEEIDRLATALKECKRVFGC